MNKLPFEEKFEEYNLAESVGLAVMVVKNCKKESGDTIHNYARFTAWQN